MNIAQEVMDAIREIVPENTLVCFTLFIPMEKANEWHGVLRVNVEDPRELFAETQKLMTAALACAAVDLRDTMGGMQ